MRTTYISIGDIELTVSFTARSAEPDVGIMSGYAEDCNVVAIDNVKSTDAEFPRLLAEISSSVPNFDDFIQNRCNLVIDSDPPDFSD